MLHPSPNLYLVRASVRLFPGAGSIRLTVVCTRSRGHLPLACTLALQTHTNSGEQCMQTQSMVCASRAFAHGSCVAGCDRRTFVARMPIALLSFW